MQLYFYFDFVSPFAYLAHKRIPVIAERYQCRLVYRPVNLQQLKRAAGNTGPSNREIPVKLRYLKADLARWADRYEVPLKFPASFNSEPLNLGSFWAIQRGRIAQYVDAAWKFSWGEGGALDDEAVLRKVVKCIDGDFDEFLAYARSPVAMRRYQEMTKASAKKGVFGVPTMMVNDEMWWGNDRVFFMEEWLDEHA